MRRSGFDIGRKPILKPLVTIQCRNAIINDDATAAVWPDANVIVGANSDSIRPGIPI